MTDEESKTLWCGNLPEQATEELLYELFLQAGPLDKVRIPRERDGRQKNFAFITYCHEVSVPYAINLFRGTALFQRTLSLQSRGRMALLPPPIRAVGPEPVIEFNHPNMAQEFAMMTERLRGDDFKAMQGPRGQELGDKLIMASLQGNWQAPRHHPYRPKDMGRGHDARGRDNRSRDDHDDNHREKNNKHWRDRRNNKKGPYHKRD